MTPSAYVVVYLQSSVFILIPSNSNFFADQRCCDRCLSRKASSADKETMEGILVEYRVYKEYP